MDEGVHARRGVLDANHRGRRGVEAAASGVPAPGAGLERRQRRRLEEDAVAGRQHGARGAGGAGGGGGGGGGPAHNLPERPHLESDANRTDAGTRVGAFSRAKE